MNMKSLWFAIAALALGLASQGFAATTQVSVLLDTDNRNGTGCTVSVKRANVADVAVPIGLQVKSAQIDEAFPGVEQRITANVEVDANGYRIRNVTRESCSNGALGAPTTVVNGPLLIERGQGTNGATAVEIVVPTTALALPGAPVGGSAPDVRLAVQTESERGSAAGVTGSGTAGSGGPPLSTPIAPLFANNVAGVPVGGVGVAALLIALVALLAFVERKRFAGVLVAIVAVGAGFVAVKPDAIAQLVQFVADGRVDDWAGVRPLYTSTNTTQNGVETTAVYVLINGQTAAFRVDVNLNAPPSATAQTMIGRADTPVAVVLAGRDLENSPLTYRIVAQPRNGTLSGTAPNLTYTPRAGFAGSDSFDFVVRDGVQDSAAATVTLNIQQVASFASTASARFTADQPNTFVVRAVGLPVPRLTASGALPAGVTFTDNGDGTAALAGRPAAAQAGIYPLTLTANNGVGMAVTQAFTLTVVEDAAFTSPASLNAVEGQMVAFDITLRGTFDQLIAHNPGMSLPAGLAYAAVGMTASRITGAPAPGSRGSYMLRLAALQSGIEIATQTLTINVAGVNQKPSFTAGASVAVNEDAPPQTVAGWATNISAGAAFESAQTLAFEVVSNSNAALFSAGPAVSPSGTLTYSPAPDANGSAMISLRLRDNGGTANGGVEVSDSASFSISVNPVNDPPRFSKGADITVMGSAMPSAFTQANWATGISPGPMDESAQAVSFLAMATSGSALFSATPSVSAMGTLSFTPAPNAAGAATVSVVAQDTGGIANGGANSSLPQTFNVRINRAPSITSAGVAFWTEGVADTFTISTQGFPQPTLALSGCTLPSGLTFTASAGGGTISGAPSAATTVFCQLTASNGVMPNGTQMLQVTVNAASSAPVFQFGSAGTANLSVGVPATLVFPVTGMPTPSVMLSGCAPALPAGLVFTPGSGTASITGVPTTPTSVSCIVTATNSAGAAMRTETINVFPPVIAVPDVVTVQSTLTTTQGAPGILANDTSPMTFPATVASFGPTGMPNQFAAGTTGMIGMHSVRFNTDGSWQITPNPMGVGATLMLEYRIINSIESTAVAPITLQIGIPPAFTSPAHTNAPIAPMDTYDPDVGGIFNITTSGDPALPRTISIDMGSPGCMLPPGPLAGNGEFVFTDNANGTATLQADSGGMRRLYTCTLTVSNGAGPPVTQTLQVMYGRFIPNHSTMVVPPGSQPYGTPRTVTATIPTGQPGGPPATGVVIVTGGSANCMASPMGDPATATCSITPQGGVTQINAAYSPLTNPYYQASMGIPQGITVTPATTMLTISPSPAMPTQNLPAAVMLTAALASATSVAPTGTFELRENGSIIAGCGALPLNAMGQATCAATFTSTGMRTLTLSYSGDANYAAASTMLSITVNP